MSAGGFKVRANDTDYPFRASSAFTWLTGETTEDAVLVMAPQGDTHIGTLYVREFAQPLIDGMISHLPEIDDRIRDYIVALIRAASDRFGAPAWRSAHIGMRG